MDMAEQQVRDEEAKHKGEEIHLFADARNGSHDSTIALRWCICPSILNKLKEELAPNPQILLVITRDNREVERRLVPLEQEMEYFYFPGPGLHRIQATILSFADVRKLKKILLDTDKIRLVGFDGDLREREYYTGLDIFETGRGDLSVDVSPEFFARKPPEWLSNWVNCWYETKPRDQCQFRRRFMLAFTIQPIVLLVYCAILCTFRLLAALILKFGCGFRGISFAAVYHPLSYDSSDVWWKKGFSVFINNKNEKPRPWFMALFMPVVVAPLAVSLCVLKCWLFPDMSFWWVLPATLGVLGGITAIGYLLPYLADKLTPLLLGTKEGRKKAKEERKRTEELEKQSRKEIAQLSVSHRYDETYSQLVCQGVPLKASLKALPRSRRTIYLRFMNFKIKVCRPFAKY